MLSLSPRYDLFRFVLPDTFLPEEVVEKYKKILDLNAGVITTPLNYLNESIQGITIPSMDDLCITQEQREKNQIQTSQRNLGRINVEAKHDVVYTSTTNPLEKVQKEFTVTFRMNQGLYNYFMIYETIFHRYVRHDLQSNDRVFAIDIIDESGKVISRVKLFDVFINGIDGLDMSYSKVERDSGTFNVLFKFNNIDFVFVDENGNEI